MGTKDSTESSALGWLAVSAQPASSMLTAISNHPCNGDLVLKFGRFIFVELTILSLIGHAFMTQYQAHYIAITGRGEAPYE